MVIVIFSHYNNNFIVKSQHIIFQNFGTAENLMQRTSWITSETKNLVSIRIQVIHNIFSFLYTYLTVYQYQRTLLQYRMLI